MPFQPLGYQFRVDLHMQPRNVKAVIDRRLKPWFEKKNGARGWIIGPFICLWFSAFDRYGPMLFGTIRSNGIGTRISGRAGSDLNGIAALVGMSALLLMAIVSATLNGEQSADMLFPLLLLLFILPLVLWMAHKDRREAEPLVRFIEETISGPRPKKRLEFSDVTISSGLALDVDGEVHEAPLTAGSIAEALQSIEDDGFLILSSTPEIYMQTAADGGSFAIEKRSGSEDSHMEAVRSGASESKWLKRDFTFDETLAALLAYASEAPMPEVIEWRPMY